MKRLVKLVVRLGACYLALLGASRLAVRMAGEHADEADDTFRLLAVMDGRSFRSRSASLRQGEVVAVLGGADVDLREAVPDPGGARVAIMVFGGGVRLLVDPSWRVTVVEDVRGGQTQIELPEAPPSGEAAEVVVELKVRGGGAVVATAEAPHHVVTSR